MMGTLLDNTQLLLAGLGVLLVVVLVLWGVRRRIKDGIRKRRRRPVMMNEPVLGEGVEDTVKDSLDEAHSFGELLITRDHYLADKALIDVEIIPVKAFTRPQGGIFPDPGECRQRPQFDKRLTDI